MRHFLIFLPLSEEHSQLHERLLTTARSFFETVGTIERRDLGQYVRGARPKRPAELLTPVLLAAQPEPTLEQDVAKARALEGVLRSTLGAARVNPVDVRVFVGRDTDDAE